jgi:CheY-like chemotaxis protein
MTERTVLLVDDDASLLDVSSRMLRENPPGVTVSTAATAEEGVRVLESERVDCVVSDSIRTGTGESFVDLVGRRRPEVPVVVFSGRSPGPEVSTAAAFVRKGAPGDLERLATTVSTLVGDENPLGPEWTLLTRHDRADDLEFGTVVALALADHLGRDSNDLPPLYDAVDPEDLAAVVAPPGRDRVATVPVSVEFSYLDCRVRVTRSGHLGVR